MAQISDRVTLCNQSVPSTLDKLTEMSNVNEKYYGPC